MKSMNEEQFQAILGLYSKKGYKIIKDPDVKNEIPPFLSSLNYIPDYIIRSENMNYIVGLSSSKNVNNENKLKNIIEEIEKNNSWEFILVVVDHPPKIDKPLPDVKTKADKHKRRAKSDKDDSAPAVKQKEDKPVPVSPQEEDTPVPDSTQKEDKPAHVADKKDEKPAPVPEPEDEQTAAGFEAEGEDTEDDFETEFEMSEIDMDSEDDDEPRSVDEPEKEKLPERSDPITNGYQSLKLMLENKQFELYREPVLLYGWTLLEAMIRKLIDKERTGIDIGFLLGEAVSYDIIDNSEVTALKGVYLSRNKLIRGDFGIAADKLQLDSLIKVVNKIYEKHFA